MCRRRFWPTISTRIGGVRANLTEAKVVTILGHDLLVGHDDTDRADDIHRPCTCIGNRILLLGGRHVDASYFLLFSLLSSFTPRNLKPHTNCRPVDGRGLQREAPPLHPNMRPIWNRGSMSISIQINEEIPLLPPPPSYSVVRAVQCVLCRSSITYNVSEVFGAQKKGC